MPEGFTVAYDNFGGAATSGSNVVDVRPVDDEIIASGFIDDVGPGFVRDFSLYNLDPTAVDLELVAIGIINEPVIISIDVNGTPVVSDTFTGPTFELVTPDPVQPGDEYTITFNNPSVLIILAQNMRVLTRAISK